MSAQNLPIPLSSALGPRPALPQLPHGCPALPFLPSPPHHPQPQHHQLVSLSLTSPSPWLAAPGAANLGPCWAPINSVFSIPILAQRHCVSCAHRNSTLVTGPSCLHIPHMLPLLRTHVSVAPISPAWRVACGAAHPSGGKIPSVISQPSALSEPQPETPRWQWLLQKLLERKVRFRSYNEIARIIAPASCWSQGRGLSSWPGSGEGTSCSQC